MGSMQLQDLVIIINFHENADFMIPGSRIIKKVLRFKGFLHPGRGGQKLCENGK